MHTPPPSLLSSAEEKTNCSSDQLLTPVPFHTPLPTEIFNNMSVSDDDSGDSGEGEGVPCTQSTLAATPSFDDTGATHNSATTTLTDHVRVFSNECVTPTGVTSVF